MYAAGNGREMSFSNKQEQVLGQADTVWKSYKRSAGEEEGMDLWEFHLQRNNSR